MRQDPLGNQGRPRRRRGGGGGLRVLVLLGLAVYGGCYYFGNRTVDPYTGEKVLIDRSLDAEDEKALGLEAYRQILAQERPVAADAQVAQQIRGIAQRLIARVDAVETALAAEHGRPPGHFSRSFDWEVTVLQSEQANAFCLPGGKIAVYTGLVPVARNADAMAVVMGHEIAHALLRHGAQRMAQQKLSGIGQMVGAAGGMDAQQQELLMSAFGYGYLLPYARSHEVQADEVGLMLAAAACFDPRQAVPLWERMSAASGGQAPPEFASTHPNPGTRIQNLQALMPKAMAYRQRFCESAQPR
ncbi:M48 family metallopeptidase [Stenotrophomonas mori]|uniref:M48 family metallopeptidase n=1 Tax=Stenotrophomonas mori TaxID=2871096 RepID=A0ABT0SGD8_9GAMM|nr:M48 family metallopeptidase [Stenotrophomonas mori]MCL7714065.1 M48 family metallopeptidase [Stenotrophomonas mori]